jgi:hypothetical protein
LWLNIFGLMCSRVPAAGPSHHMDHQVRRDVISKPYAILPISCNYRTHLSFPVPPFPSGMTPSNVQGLNNVHSPPSPNQDSDSFSNTLSYQDLSAQLELWAKLAFDNDVPHENYSKEKESEGSSREGKNMDKNDALEWLALHGAHHDVDTGKTAIIEDNISTGATISGSMPPPQTSFDLTNLFAGFGFDSLLVPQIPNSQQADIVPSLAQLLAADPSITALFQQQLQQSHPPQPPSTYSDQPSSESVPERRSKRSRTRNLSISTVDSTPDFLDGDGTPSPNTTPLSVVEDKRRRNTAASARFRLKKKEWETALEKKSKDLEGRVEELERECEGLRRENGWLKGLIVGASSAAPNQVVTAPIAEETKGNQA